MQNRGEFGIPIGLGKIAVSLQEMIKEQGIKNFSLYIGDDDSPYGIVLVGGDRNRLMGGIHAMIGEIANDMGKTNEEVVDMILHTGASPVNVMYQ